MRVEVLPKYADLDGVNYDERSRKIVYIELEEEESDWLREIIGQVVIAKNQEFPTNTFYTRVPQFNKRPYATTPTFKLIKKLFAKSDIEMALDNYDED